MPLATDPAKASTKQRSKSVDHAGSKHAIDEINAYITIRDGLVAEAERVRTGEILRRACIANDFLATCLTPARTPYETQCLPESDAERERERCEAMKVRLAELAARRGKQT